MTTPEQRARQTIDTLLTAAGWQVQDRAELNLGAGRGVAAREFALRTGFDDYVLFVDRKAIGAVEAKVARAFKVRALRAGAFRVRATRVGAFN